MSSTHSSQGDTLQQKQAIIAEHLPSGYGTTFNGTNVAGNSGLTTHQSSLAPDISESAEQNEESSLLLHGGDIHRGLYKLNARAGASPLVRARTFSYPPRNPGDDDDDDDLSTAEQMLLPQGFRRHFVKKRLERHGAFEGGDLPFTRNFVEFLDLYGSFAGEDLSDSDAEEEEEEQGEEEEEEEEDLERVPERRPLIWRRGSSRFAKRGDAGTLKTFFTTLKAFIGTGIMFLPKAFNNGGILFSSITLIFIAIISMVAFHLLLSCRARHGGSYGELGRQIGGKKMRALILGSITLSQLGFVCTGLVFVADNVLSVLQAITHEDNPLSTQMLIAIQAIVLVPLAFIRNISKLGPFALLADIFIVVGVGYIWSYDISTLAANGIHPTVQLFNPKAYTLTIGASIFTFEGIGLILPIQDSMHRPEQYERILGTVMLIITCIFTGVGALCYATFGSATQIEVINNFPQDSKLVNAVQFMYALAVLIGNPVQLFPAMRIIESKIFGHRSGKRDMRTKWKKNAFRSALVAVCIGVSVGGSQNLDRFVALIGSFACVPLVYIYPPFLHYMAVAETGLEKTGDMALMILGIVGMIYTTAITLATSFLH